MYDGCVCMTHSVWGVTRGSVWRRTAHHGKLPEHVEEVGNVAGLVQVDISLDTQVLEADLDCGPPDARSAQHGL